jgi:2-amino-4-hydroxy-6-hydroxymethyldihydropteridine diphosphokinase
MRVGAEAVFVAIGANLPDRNGNQALHTCKAAVEALRGLPEMRFLGVSRWYETEPIPAGGPSYVNGVAWLEGAVDPSRLLLRLQAIEARAGRVREAVNAPRTLDLDIVAIGGMTRLSPDPILPHPRMHLRRFVLEPLAELAPEWLHPTLHMTVTQMIAELPAQGVRLL